MKNKWLRKLFSIALVFVLIHSCANLASAAVSGNTKSEYLVSTQEYPNGMYAAITTVPNTIYYEVPGTRAEHVEGATLTITVSKTTSHTESATGTIGCAASAELGANIADLANAALTGSLSASFGFGTSETSSVAAGVGYTLGTEKAPGFYCIAIAYPGMSVTQKVYGTKSNNIQVTEWQKKIDYIPLEGQSYYTLLSVG